MKKYCLIVLSIVVTLMVIIFLLRKESAQNINNSFSSEESKAITKQIELTDYIELSVMEFIEETGIMLQQDAENKNIWKTEDNTIWVETENDQIIYLSISRLTEENESKQPVEENSVITVAGISLGDEISRLRETVLKGAEMETEGGCCFYYTSLDLSRLGIERLALVNTTVDCIEAYFDLSLKKSSEGLEYIWEEKVLQKEGSQNDMLETTEDACVEMQKYYEHPEYIDKTIVQIRYPYLEIPEKPVITQNANNLILETVKRIEEETYQKTDRNIIVQADYMITYITSRFISITFRVYVTGRDIEEKPWQYCNINMTKNGEGATLSDIGLSRNEIYTACSNAQYKVDIEDYMKAYDTGWNQYRITPTKYVLYVKVLDENKESQNNEKILAIELFRSWYG